MKINSIDNSILKIVQEKQVINTRTQPNDLSVPIFNFIPKKSSDKNSSLPISGTAILGTVALGIVVAIMSKKLPIIKNLIKQKYSAIQKNLKPNTSLMPNPISQKESKEILKKFSTFHTDGANHYLKNCDDIFVNELLSEPSVAMTLLGCRPGCIAEPGFKIKNLKNIPKNLRILNANTPTNDLFIFNKKAAIKKIAENREFFIKRLKLNPDIKSSDIFDIITLNNSPLHNLNGLSDIIGILLGYPQKSSMIYHLEYNYRQIHNITNLTEFRNNISLFKNSLKNYLYSPASPYKDMGEKFKNQLAKEIDRYKGTCFSDKYFSRDLSYPFAMFVEEPDEMNKIISSIRKFGKILDKLNAKIPSDTLPTLSMPA